MKQDRLKTSLVLLVANRMGPIQNVRLNLKLHLTLFCSPPHPELMVQCPRCSAEAKVSGGLGKPVQMTLLCNTNSIVKKPIEH